MVAQFIVINKSDSGQMCHYEEVRRFLPIALLAFTVLLGLATVTGLILYSKAHRTALPFLGHWNGTFIVSKNGSDMPTDRLTLSGFIQLYRTGNRLVSQFANPAQEVDTKGHWKVISPTRISLHFSGYKLTEGDLVALKASGASLFKSNALRKAFSQDLVLDLSSDKLHLKGLLIHIGPLQGHFFFKKITLGED